MEVVHVCSNLRMILLSTFCLYFTSTLSNCKLDCIRVNGITERNYRTTKRSVKFKKSVSRTASQLFGIAVKAFHSLKLALGAHSKGSIAVASSIYQQVRLLVNAVPLGYPMTKSAIEKISVV